MQPKSERRKMQEPRSFIILHFPFKLHNLKSHKTNHKPLQQSLEQLDLPTRSVVLSIRQSLTEKMAFRFSRRYYDGTEHKDHFCMLTCPEALHNGKSHSNEYFNILLIDLHLSIAKGRSGRKREMHQSGDGVVLATPPAPRRHMVTYTDRCLITKQVGLAGTRGDIWGCQMETEKLLCSLGINSVQFARMVVKCRRGNFFVIWELKVCSLVECLSNLDGETSLQSGN